MAAAKAELKRARNGRADWKCMVIMRGIGQNLLSLIVYSAGRRWRD
jgi:hypothetical protein